MGRSWNTSGQCAGFGQLAYVDDFGDAVLKLDVNGQILQICDSWEIIQGRTDMRIDAYHVQEYYDAVISSIFDYINHEHPESLNIDQIKNEVLPEFWRVWREKGIVTDDYR